MMGVEEDSIQQAAAARRESLRALTAALELINPPTKDSAQLERGLNDAEGSYEEIISEVMGAEEDSIQKAAVARQKRLTTLKTTLQLLEKRDLRLYSSSEVMEARGDLIREAATFSVKSFKARLATLGLRNPPAKDSAQVERELNDENGTNKENELNMKFRNYVAHDKQHQEGKLAPPVLSKFEDPVAAVPPSAEEKPNWDLRRDGQKKLDELERRTQKALFKLLGFNADM